MSVTQRDTKAVIFAAYQELQAENRRLQKQIKASPAAAASGTPRPAPRAPARAASGSVEDIDGILSGLESLRSCFGDSAGTLQSKLTKEAERLAALKSEVEAHSAHLHELHQITASDDTLADLIHTYNDTADAFQAEMEGKEQSLTESLDRQRAEWNKEKELHRLRIRERDHQVEMSRQRDEDEYTYTLQHQRAMDADQHEQQQSQLVAALDKLRADRDREWSDREQELARREEAYASLKERVLEFDETLAREVRSAHEEGAAVARRQAKNAAELIAKDNEGILQVNELKIASLTQSLSKQAAEVSELAAKLNAAQRRAQELAVKAIEGASNETSFVAIKEIALEQAKAAQPKR